MKDDNVLLNGFAIRSFRDIADGDYIAARMACRAQLVVQYLWASQQAIEKYLKCILLLNRIPAADVKHNLSRAIAKIAASGELELRLVKPTEDYIFYLDRYGQYRYLEVSNYAAGRDLVNLDRAVWELRRFCTLDPRPSRLELQDKTRVPRVRLFRGRLEAIIDDVKNPARSALLWQNGFFGRRVRETVTLDDWSISNNAPLYLNPQLLAEVEKYVFLPPGLIKAYREYGKSKQGSS